MTLSNIYKILFTLFLLEQKMQFLNRTGLSNILHGNINEDICALKNMDTFSSLVSISKKKINLIVTTLIKKGVIEEFFYPPTSSLYLRLTKKGNDLFHEIHDKNPPKIKKNENKTIPQIITLHKF